MSLPCVDQALVSSVVSRLAADFEIGGDLGHCAAGIEQSGDLPTKLWWIAVSHVFLSGSDMKSQAKPTPTTRSNITGESDGCGLLTHAASGAVSRRLQTMLVRSKPSESEAGQVGGGTVDRFATLGRSAIAILAVMASLSACTNDSSETSIPETSSETSIPETSSETSNPEREACAEEVSQPESWQDSSIVGCGDDVRLGAVELDSVTGASWDEDTGEVNGPRSHVGIFEVVGCDSNKVSDMEVDGVQVAELLSYNSETDSESSVWQDVLVLRDETSARALWESRFALLSAFESCGGSPTLSESIERVSPVKGFSGDLMAGTRLVESSTSGYATLIVDRSNGEQRPVAIIQAGRYYTELWLTGDPELDGPIRDAAQYRMSLEK